MKKEAKKKDDYYKVKNLKKRLDGSCVTAGSTADDNYSLTLQVFDNKPCLCVHKCEKVDGWHWSTMNDKSFVAAISIDRLKWAVEEIERRDYWFKKDE